MSSNNWIEEAIKSIAGKRPIFHSEADFQFSLGWELKIFNNNLEIIMERPFQFKNQSNKCPKIELDLLIKDGSKKFGVELKYVTKALNTEINSESFNLKNHMATNLRRYDFYKDISRLECLKKAGEIDNGYALFLTNVDSYQKDTSGMAGSFKFADKHQIKQGQYNWNGKKINDKSIGSYRGNEIKINGQYDCCWMDYSDGFKYLLLEV